MNSNTQLPPMPTERLGFGLHTLVDNKPAVRLPLKAVDARFEVCGDCAQVTMEQIYEFEGPNPVDVIYTFPLPADASVHECTMTINGRRVAAVVKPLEEARTEFHRARRTGKRALLVESVRDNLFELRLGNVQPGDSITVSISYTESLVVEGTKRRLRIPVCPGVRYVPGRPIGVDGGTDIVPDAGRLNPVRVDNRHPDAATFFCAGTIIGASQIESPTHIIETLKATEDKRTPVRFNDDSEVPDRDFVLSWEARGNSVALRNVDDEDFLLCSFRTPEDLPTARGDRDIFFLLDSSGSMHGRNWYSLVEAMNLALNELGERDQFSIHLFSHHLHPLTEGLLKATSQAKASTMNQLRSHQPDGGTELTGAFGRIIRLASSARRPVIVIVTDGQVGDEERSCALANKAGIEVHTVGIDANVNDAVLSKIARRTRGSCTLCAPGEDLDQKIHQLVSHLLCPTMNRITSDNEWFLVGNTPPLRRGQTALVPFRRNRNTQDTTLPPHLVLNLEFSDGSRRRQSLDIYLTKGKFPSILAAKAGITAYLDDDQKDQAVELACRYNVICDGAAFVAIDEAEKVQVASAIMEQPSQEPDSDLHAMLSMDSLCQSAYLEDGLSSCYQNTRYSLVSPPASSESGTKWERAQRFLRRKEPEIHGFATKKGQFEENATKTRSVSPSKNHSPAEIDWVPWMMEKARMITFFEMRKWERLLVTALFPWAQEHENNAKLLRRLLRDLQGENNAGPDFARIAAYFNILLPFLPREARRETNLFLQSLDISASNNNN